jgi:hypothetical protein
MALSGTAYVQLARHTTLESRKAGRGKYSLGVGWLTDLPTFMKLNIMQKALAVYSLW